MTNKFFSGETMLQNLQKNDLSRNLQTSVLQQGLFGFLR